MELFVVFVFVVVVIVVNLFIVCVDHRSSSSTNVDCVRLLSSTSFLSFFLILCGYTWRSKPVEVWWRWASVISPALPCNSRARTHIHTKIHTTKLLKCQSVYSPWWCDGRILNYRCIKYTNIHRVCMWRRRLQVQQTVSAFWKPLRLLSSIYFTQTTIYASQISNVKHNLVFGHRNLNKNSFCFQTNCQMWAQANRPFL